jgi:hypothetical protein
MAKPSRWRGKTGDRPNQLQTCRHPFLHSHSPIRRLELELEADVNTMRFEERAIPIPKPSASKAFACPVQTDADAFRDVLSALISHATLWSPVANMIHSPAHLDVVLAPAMETEAFL